MAPKLLIELNPRPTWKIKEDNLCPIHGPDCTTLSLRTSKNVFCALLKTEGTQSRIITATARTYSFHCSHNPTTIQLRPNWAGYLEIYAVILKYRLALFTVSSYTGSPLLLLSQMRPIGAIIQRYHPPHFTNSSRYTPLRRCTTRSFRCRRVGSILGVGQ